MKNVNSSFGGVLQPLVELLEHNPRKENRLIGKEISVSRKDVKAIIALDTNDDIHLLIMPSTKGKFNVSKLDLKGLQIVNKDWSVSDYPVQDYLDISCSTGVLPAFRRPFLRFAEDLLFEILQSEILPADAVFKTGVRWKKFWSPDSGAEVTKEWIHGLFGELLFLTELIDRFGSNVVNCWAGPFGKDHDFQTGDDLAVEVKTSVEVPISINCNIRQLDSDLFKKLYIICYRLTPSETGTTLTQLVRKVEELVKDNEVLLDKFYGLLTKAGYTRQSESDYESFRLNYSSAAVYHVNKDFPKIVEKSFSSPPDHRISAIRFTLQLTGIKELSVDSIADELRNFAKQ